ncbi:MAG TPA: ATPase, T2SS/T4P/T4SS family, partial [Terriglobia bacterium]|nr:ATPase, T2SS/T4P/T4SS family [Terriglobia bacterium]
MAVAAIDTDELVNFLRNVKLFAELHPDSLARVSSWFKFSEFSPGETIVREGTAGMSMFIIKSGLVEVRKKDATTGIEFFVTQLGPGAAVGEMAMLTGKPRSATITTVEPTVTLTLTRSDFRHLLAEHAEIALSLARILADRLEDTNRQIGISFINLSRSKFESRVVGLIPHSLIMLHKIVPVAFSAHNNAVTLAMVNPSNLPAFDDVRRYVKGAIIEPRICTEDDFQRFMESVYPQLMGRRDRDREFERKFDEKKRKDKPAPEQHMESLEELQNEILAGMEIQADQEEKPADIVDLAAASEDAPVVRLANNILSRAIQKGASDIHIEPQETGVKLRLRIDGVLRVESELSKKMQLPLISRLKIMARLDISERRLPQDGRISIRLDGRPIDFRLSTVPAKFGEKVVMRILDKGGALMPLDKIILDSTTVDKLRWMITQPYGIIYVTGPTGSGKTTTLYSSLNEINAPEVNISTAEDPIEYDLSGLCQVQTHKDIGLDFARILRAFLRQDPDVILVGETRDQETAKISVEAALTGHLVFTTLHTNDAPGAFTRLEEMGIEPFLMASSTIGIVAQRLARRICQNCKEEHTIDDASLSFFGYNRDNAPKFYKGHGCMMCSGSGYKGRVGIYELLMMNEELKRAIVAGAKTDVIRDIAVKSGMKTLKMYAMMLMEQGLTTV